MSTNMNEKHGIREITDDVNNAFSTDKKNNLSSSESQKWKTNIGREVLDTNKYTALENDSNKPLNGDQKWEFNETTNEWEEISLAEESHLSQEWEYNYDTNQWVEKNPQSKKKQEVNDAYLDASLRRKEDKATGTVTENYGDDLMR